MITLKDKKPIELLKENLNAILIISESFIDNDTIDYHYRSNDYINGWIEVFFPKDIFSQEEIEECLECEYDDLYEELISPKVEGELYSIDYVLFDQEFDIKNRKYIKLEFNYNSDLIRG